MTQVAKTEDITSNPKFIVRYTLGLFLLSNWLYNTLVTGEEGIADFSQMSSDVFNDKMFYVGAYNQVKELVADINDERIVEEMTGSKTFLLNKTKLKEVRNLNEDKMKELAETGVSVYSMILTKKLAENVIFDDDVIPTAYTSIDGANDKATDISIPLSLVFSVDSELLDKISNLLDMTNTTIVKEVIGEFKLDEKMACFTSTFNFLELIDAKQ